MQDYFLKSTFSEKADRLGTVFMLFCGSLLFFLLLWGVRLPALTAGLGLFAFIMTLRWAGRERRLKQKENNLRRRIGGELALERLLLQPGERIHLEIALLLSDRYNLQMDRILPEGVVCVHHQQTLLIHYLQCHPSETVRPSQVAHLQRLARVHSLSRVILCTPSAPDHAARAQAALSPTVTFVGKETLIRLLGSASPATDSQLVALSHRRKQALGGQKWWRRLFAPHLMSRYLQYAALMASLFFLTGQTVYALPAILLMVFAVICRCKKAPRESL